jgi:hypothetical protein
MNAKDFRKTSQSAFQGLKSLCYMVNRTINDSLILFYSNQYISANVIHQKQFYLETELLINQFRLSMISSFLLSLTMIRSTTQANTLFSALQTNYQPFIINYTFYSAFIIQTYNNCSCASSSTCIEPSSIYNHLTLKSLFDVSGFYVGCYVIESLLQSTLEYFYDQEYIDKLRTYLPMSSSIDVIALNRSSASVYYINSTIQELIDNLMIEQWNPSILYEQYYNECQPTQCRYTFETRNDVIYIVTTLFGIAGGLITVLKFVVPQLINFIIYCIRKHRQRVVPT